MLRPILRGFLFLVCGYLLVPGGMLVAQEVPRFQVELEVGPVWQGRNNVQIPNEAPATRFSLKDLAGQGPWPTGRLYLTWNLNQRHSLRVLLAPLTIEETGTVDEPVSFAGAEFDPGSPVQGTYQFNSWRVGYRYRFLERQDLDLRVGFTAKIRDAKVALAQGETASKDTNVGFVPLLHFSGDWQMAEGAHLLLDFDGLAGGPGRAFDVGLKVGFDLGDHWRIGGGYRTLEGGADVETAYNFAWLHYGVVSLTFFQ
ncbi:MAG: hypothetical protein HKO65_11435 [Gemmatimonadetes bacterium]|nr:hypothetical protein [Gemmatimonadota bacterium]NNM05689.1 hypothetical protein [Gemmatimonadota bacterium]